MSEMTATRMIDRVRTGWTWRRIARIATLAVLAALWILAAGYLWRTKVPSNLDLSHLDARRYFGAAELSRTESYERFVRIDWLLAVLASLGALVYMAWKAPKIAPTIGIGRIGKGLIIGMVTLTALWFVGFPFALAERWWEGRHHLVRGSIVPWLSAQLPMLATEAVFACLSFLIVLALAGWFPRRWWIAAAPAFAGLTLLFAFVFPWIDTLGTHRLHDPALRAKAAELERKEGVQGTPIRVDDVSAYTRQANAMSEGIGPSRRVILWDTLLNGRFSDDQVVVVMAHELGHTARGHIWKGVAWFALFALPGTYLIAVVTRRRGGARDPGLLPLGLLVLFVLQLVGMPVTNVISRRYEAEADWIALRTTNDPAAMRGLMQGFSRTSLQQPNPPAWDYLLLENHPTIAQRIAMANAWKARQGR
jgi:Zn-dependent protease with chaperone function